MHKYGHMLLRSLLGRQRFDMTFRGAPIVAQFSSLGSLTGAWLSEIRESLTAGSYSSGDPSQSAGNALLILFREHVRNRCKAMYFYPTYLQVLTENGVFVSVKRHAMWGC